MRIARRLILLIFVLWVPVASQAADSYSEIIGKHLALTQGDEVDPAPAIPQNHTGLVLAVAALGVLVFALWRTIHLRRVRSNSLIPLRAAEADLSQSLLAEQSSLETSFTELRGTLNTPAPHPAAARLNSVRHQAGEKEPSIATNPLQEFLDSATSRIAKLRTLFSEVSRASDEAARQKSLLEFLHEVCRVKEGSQMLELRPVWLIACALEGLINQLARKTSHVTPSVLGTAAAAVDLLEALAVRGLDPNLASDPPVRILAVDDDAVSRLAISFALKKAFNEPDLAPDGEGALGLAARQTYDVMFLDVEMPGMDGFELCTKIHETVPNRNTPVVFVTRHSDFASRAKSSLSGGRDLIAKPFLAFEITVKALTLALRARLVNAAEPGSANKVVVSSETAPVKTAITPKAPAASPQPSSVAPLEEMMSARTGDQKASDSNSAKALQPTASQSTNDSSAVTSRDLNDYNFTAMLKSSQDGSDNAFFTRAPAHLLKLRNRLDTARQAEPTDLQKVLGELYVGVHSMSLEAERAELRAVFRLGSALEGMLKKLLEHPTLCSPSTLNAASAALELLEELCRPESNADQANPPIRLLVVDDDPVARRAICGSLQLVFGKPDSADCGESALTLAAKNPFDLIFLDVMMPGIDGFTTCAKIHETTPNRLTPVVFITSHNDADSRSQAAVSGGCGFLPKPVLASQIKLMALTFTLRARLNKSEPEPVAEEAACLEMT